MNGVVRQLFQEEHVSVSAISRYLKCPRSYKYKYVDKLQAETRASALVFGGAIHETLALFYKALRDEQPEPDLTNLMAAFHFKFEDDLKANPPVMFSDKETTATLMESAKAMLEVFLAEAERPFKVVDVETPFSLDIGSSKRLVGVLDAVIQDSDGKYRILEHKTAARRWSESRISSDLQITVYQLAAPMLGLGNTNSVDIQLLLKTKKSGLEIYPARRTQADKDDALETIDGVLRAAEAGAFYPCRDWWCGSCEFASKCMAG